ncbi:MAG: 4-hydroxy-tetrahydrodipicolinate synthase, partial [Clostridia bacterium]|nr:4-hydroxy-tetrahydrodipicolinate synthase [Clostridia bacterium]
TGEAATLSDTERYKIFEFSRERVAGRVPLIFGTGTNDTRVAVEHTKEAERIGCDGALVVTPYYNKGTEEGIYRHYMTIAEATGLPIILYNVPSRTGVNLGIPILKRLAKCERILGIKEATDSVDRLAALAVLKDELPLYAGNDSGVLPSLALGGKGVISVVSNLYPKEMVKLCKSVFCKDIDGARDIQLNLLPLINSLFLETNPAPVKYAMSLLSLSSDELRLPLSEVRESTKEVAKEREGILIFFLAISFSLARSLSISASVRGAVSPRMVPSTILMIRVE